MPEIVNTYLLSNPKQLIPMKREEFYKEQIAVFKKTGKPSRAIEVIQILLFTSDQEIILQKRSGKKNHNAGLMDKAIGGHIQHKNTPTYTVMVETLQELQIPSFVLDSEDDFDKTLKLLYKYLSGAAMVQLVDSKTEIINKVFKGEKIPIANKYHFFIGAYDGSVKPIDKEASGILFYNYNSFKKEIKAMPDFFTEDLKYFTTKYNKEINNILAKLKKIAK